MIAAAAWITFASSIIIFLYSYESLNDTYMEGLLLGSDDDGRSEGYFQRGKRECNAWIIGLFLSGGFEVL